MYKSYNDYSMEKMSIYFNHCLNLASICKQFVQGRQELGCLINGLLIYICLHQNCTTYLYVEHPSVMTAEKWKIPSKS